MARYYSYGRRRYGRRYYRRGYRRYGGTSLRRYRSVQMNDNETRVMTFTNVIDDVQSLSTGSSAVFYRTGVLLGAETNNQIKPSAGRIFFAGMMFDRLRIRSISLTVRPKVMPSSTATNYMVYAAWDRYTAGNENAAYNVSSIRTDPSAKQVVWTPGGSGSPLRTWIYSTTRDRYQYLPINHATDLKYWYIYSTNTFSEFYPTFLLAVEAVTAGSTSVQYTIIVRSVIEFQGGYSNTTLDYTPSARVASAQPATASLGERISSLEKMYNSNPADNNDDLVSVLNELSNPQ